MQWFRSLAAELFPSWHERRLLKQLKGDNYASMNGLAKLRRAIDAADDVEADHTSTRRLNGKRGSEPHKPN